MEYLDNAELDQSQKDVKETLSQEKTWPAYNKTFWEKVEKIPRDSRIVEAGCGGGWMASQMIDDMGFENITLLDFDDYRAESSAKNCAFHKIDFAFNPWALETESVDIVMSIQVLEHLENPFYYIREAHRVLVPKGKLFLAIPNGWNFFSKILFFKKAYIDGYTPTNNHISFFSKDVFFHKLMRGFQCVDQVFHHRSRLPLPLIRYFRFPYPPCEFFSRKVCFIFEKRAN